VKAEALRDAADDIELPSLDPDTGMRHWSERSVAVRAAEGWLRRRADRIEGITT
jgi:hypothetical protein